jgi:hypothetical protein
VYPEGRVEHQEGEPTTSAIRKALGGYRPVEVSLDGHLTPLLRVFRADIVSKEALANYAVRAITHGHVVPPIMPIVGRMVVTGVDGEGLPVDVLARLANADRFARSRTDGTVMDAEHLAFLMESL